MLTVSTRGQDKGFDVEVTILKCNPCPRPGRLAALGIRYFHVDGN